MDHRQMRDDKPRRAAEPVGRPYAPDAWKSLLKRGVAVVAVSGIGLTAVAAFTVSSATATAAVSTPLGISSIGTGLSASSPASAADLAEQHDSALAQQADEINEAAAGVVADKRAASLQQTSADLAKENDRLKTLAKFMWPTKGGVGSVFGMRLHPILHVWRMHDGDDIGGTCGQPIWAAQSGTVVKAETGYNGGSGNNVWIDNGDINGVNVQSGYLHMRDYTVKVGQAVDKGDVIGYVGSTGLSTACHLHFSIKKDGKESDPMEYIGWNKESTEKDAPSSNE